MEKTYPTLTYFLKSAVCKTEEVYYLILQLSANFEAHGKSLYTISVTENKYVCNG